MKRRALLKHLQEHRCELLREGGRHSVYWNPANQMRTRLPALRADGFLFSLALLPAPADALGPFTAAAALAAHALGLLAVFRMAHWPILLAPLVLIGLLLSFRLAGRSFPASVAALTPLAALYFAGAVRLVLTRLTPFEIPAWLDYRWAAALAGLWVALGLVPRPVALRAGLAASLAWAGYLYLLNRPAGVTGSDPFAYVQMAVDLATHGSLLHRFPLAGIAFDLNLPVYPTLHVGYKIPYDGASATVWPPGYSALLAVAYRLAGDPGLTLLNPVLGLLSALATFFLAARLFKDHPRRLLIGAFAAFLLATSTEQAIRLATPLADVAAQLFTTLALALALLASDRPTPDPQSPIPNRQSPASSLQLLTSAAAGLAFGLAYDIRYTQLLIAPAFLYLGLTSRRRWRLLIPFFAAALLAALPDLYYHRLAFGSPFATGSEELIWFSTASIPQSIGALSSGLAARKEFGLLLPFMAIGLAVLPRRPAAVLALAYLPPLLFHLPYFFLKLRDLLWLFPALAVLSAFGVAWAMGRLRGAGWRSLAVGLALTFVLIRFAGTLPLRHGFMTFGQLQPNQRASLERLAELTEPEAVIASSLNGGAVELYGQRLAVRPGRLLQPGKTWTDEEWLQFTGTLISAGRPVYLLMDGAEMAGPKAALESRYTLTPVATLDVPYYYLGGGSDNLTVPLYRISSQ